MVPATFYLKKNDARLCVRFWSHKGEPIIMLHGGPGMPDYMMPVANMLRHDLQVITYDQRGGGNSNCYSGDFSFQRHIEDLEVVAEKFDLGCFHLLGHSWGGLLAQLYSQSHPDRVKSLFLCNAMTGIGRDFLRMAAFLLSHYHYAAGWKGSLKMDLGFLLLIIPGPMRVYGARMLYRQIWKNFFAFSNFKPKINDHWLRGIHGDAVPQMLLSLAKAPAKLLHPVCLSPQIPVLSLYGTHDVFGPEYKAVFKRYPWARKKLVPCCGHIPWAQNPIAFSVLLNEFYAPYALKHTANLNRSLFKAFPSPFPDIV